MSHTVSGVTTRTPFAKERPVSAKTPEEKVKALSQLQQIAYSNCSKKSLSTSKTVLGLTPNPFA